MVLTAALYQTIKCLFSTLSKLVQFHLMIDKQSLKADKKFQCEQNTMRYKML